jgi:hypothetical protein
MSQSFLYKIDPKHNELASGREAVLRTLAYFDIFHYPLTCDEIREFSGKKIKENVFLEALRLLLEERRIFFFENVYTLHENPLLQHRRNQGNLRAERLLVKAKRTGRFLYQFPFVTAIGISGSLSKNYADEKADFDFFIIARADRLWICRTIMHLFKKFTYLAGRQHHYCMNYYLDEKSLLLPDQNFFTAIELKTLIPVAGAEAMKHFFEANAWSGEFLPACRFRKNDSPEKDHSLLKRFVEKLTGSYRLNHFLFRLTSKRWQAKEARGLKNRKGIPMGLISSLHYAKADPGGFQQKILEMHEEKISQVLR